MSSAMTVLRMAGAAYLIWMGVMLGRAEPVIDFWKVAFSGQQLGFDQSLEGLPQEAVEYPKHTSRIGEDHWLA
jgi:hypothetical protein